MNTHIVYIETIMWRCVGHSEVDTCHGGVQVEGVSAYRGVRPEFVLVSSAAVERNARLMTGVERECSIPIVKLNPGNYNGGNCMLFLNVVEGEGRCQIRMNIYIYIFG